MIILKAVHEARLAAKDAEIGRLQNEVAWLRNFIHPAPKAAPAQAIEADLLLGASQEAVEYASPELSPEQKQIQREAANLLNGTY